MAFCNTLLVPPEKLVPPAASGDILQTNIFGTQRLGLTHVQASRKRFRSQCLNQEIRWIVDVIIEIQDKNTNIEKIKISNLNNPPKWLG